MPILKFNPRKIAGYLLRYLRRHPRIVLVTTFVIAVTITATTFSAGLALTNSITAVLLMGLSWAPLAYLVTSLVRSGRIAENVDLLTRYIYQGTNAPEATSEMLQAIELGFIAKNKTFESVWLIDKLGLIDSVQTKYLARLARQLGHRGYFAKALIYYDLLSQRGHLAENLAERQALQTRFNMLSSNFDLKLPKTKVDKIQGRVLHVVKQTILDKQAGYTIRTHKIARAQAELGIDVHVVGQFGFGQGFTQKVVDGVVYHSLSDGNKAKHGSDVDWFKANTKALAKLAKTLRPEYLHAASDFTNAAAANLAGHSLGIKVIYEMRGFWEETFLSGFNIQWGKTVKPLDDEGNQVLPDNYLLRQASESKWARESDFVLTLAPTMQERIESFGVPANKIALVPNGVDPQEFTPMARDHELVKSLNLTQKHVIVGYVSSLSAYEGVNTLIAGVAHLKKLNPSKKIALLVVGGGKEFESLKAQAIATGFDDIIMVGQVPHSEVTRYYSIIDVFVVPRLPYEVCHLVTPLKPYEAMAMGKALVMSNVRALAAIAAESRAALTFEAGNPESLAEVLGTLVDDPASREKLGDRATKWVRKERTWSQIAKITSRVYQQLRNSA